jgi:hypothetical protein
MIEVGVAFGLGAVLSKIFDYFWVQPFLARKETSSWLREHRREAYTEFSANILSLAQDKSYKNPFEHRTLAAKAILLTDDQDLCKDIDNHIAKRDLLFRIQDGVEESDKDPERMYYELNDEADDIVHRLKRQLRSQVA